MNVIHIFLSAGFVFLSAYLPGRVIAGKLNLTPLEKTGAAFGISFILYFILGLSAYVFLLPTASCFLILLVLSLLFSLRSPNNVKIINKREIKIMLIYFFIFTRLSPP